MPVTTYSTVNGSIVSENRGGVDRDYGRDGLGSTAALYDSSGAKTDEFRYWPYGEEAMRTGSTDTPFRHVGTLGYYRDSSSYTYVRARFLLPRLARWMTVDPLWPGERAYEYVEGSPTVSTDPSGRQSRGCPRHGGEPGCVFNGPPGSESDPAYWHCQTPYYPHPDPGFWEDGLWGYGTCCGVQRKCGPTSKTYSCTDESCKAHDNCVGATWPGLTKWLSCNRRFCNDIKFCWNRSCAKAPYDRRQCQAIGDIALVFCKSFGGLPPNMGNVWR